MTDRAASDQQRSFVEDLTRPQQKLFDELQELVAHQEGNLAWYHRAGRKVLELQGGVEKQGAGWTRGLAGALGLSASSLTKMRKFASDFTQRQAERLDQLGAGWGLVVVVQHARTSDRMKLLEEAVAKGWGVIDFQTVVKQRYGVRNPGGRPLRQPRSVKDGLMQLQALNAKWLRFHRETWAGGDEPLQDRLGKLSAQELRRLTPRLKELRGTMQNIHRCAQAADKLLATRT